MPLNLWSKNAETSRVGPGPVPFYYQPILPGSNHASVRHSYQVALLITKLDFLAFLETKRADSSVKDLKVKDYQANRLN